MIIQFDPQLVEEAVHLAISAQTAKSFHGEREAIYSHADAGERERAFADLHNRWFQQMKLDGSVHQALSREPLIGQAITRCTVAPARRPAQEGAELYVRPPEPGLAERDRRRVVIQLRATTLVDRQRLEPLLQRELLHIADMLDPTFGYRPALPASTAGPTHDRLLMDRYSAVWATSVVGRLVNAGRLPRDARRGALHGFATAFPMFGENLDTLFARFFDGERPSHSEVVHFAQEPRAASGKSSANDPGSRCSLCNMPAYAFESIDDPQALADIARDYPEWRVSDRACPQCADLYRVRCRRESISEGAAGAHVTPSRLA